MNWEASVEARAGKTGEWFGSSVLRARRHGCVVCVVLMEVFRSCANLHMIAVPFINMLCVFVSNNLLIYLQGYTMILYAKVRILKIWNSYGYWI